MTTFKTIRALWNTQPTSEKLAGLVVAFGLPLLMLGFAVMLP